MRAALLCAFYSPLPCSTFQFRVYVCVCSDSADAACHSHAFQQLHAKPSPPTASPNERAALSIATFDEYCRVSQLWSVFKQQRRDAAVVRAKVKVGKREKDQKKEENTAIAGVIGASAASSSSSSSSPTSRSFPSPSSLASAHHASWDAPEQQVTGIEVRIREVNVSERQKLAFFHIPPHYLRYAGTSLEQLEKQSRHVGDDFHYLASDAAFQAELGDSRWWMAEARICDQAVMIGSVGMKLEKQDGKTIGKLRGFGVDETFRNVGLGSRLLMIALAYAFECPHKRTGTQTTTPVHTAEVVYLYAFNTAKDAIKLYEAKGFQLVFNTPDQEDMESQHMHPTAPDSSSTASASSSSSQQSPYVYGTTFSTVLKYQMTRQTWLNSTLRKEYLRLNGGSIVQCPEVSSSRETSSASDNVQVVSQPASELGLLSDPPPWLSPCLAFCPDNNPSGPGSTLEPIASNPDLIQKQVQLFLEHAYYVAQTFRAARTASPLFYMLLEGVSFAVHIRPAAPADRLPLIEFQSRVHLTTACPTAWHVRTQTGNYLDDFGGLKSDRDFQSRELRYLVAEVIISGQRRIVAALGCKFQQRAWDSSLSQSLHHVAGAPLWYAELEGFSVGQSFRSCGLGTLMATLCLDNIFNTELHKCIWRTQEQQAQLKMVAPSHPKPAQQYVEQLQTARSNPSRAASPPSGAKLLQRSISWLLPAWVRDYAGAATVAALPANGTLVPSVPCAELLTPPSSMSTAAQLYQDLGFTIFSQERGRSFASIQQMRCWQGEWLKRREGFWSRLETLIDNSDYEQDDVTKAVSWKD